MKSGRNHKNDDIDTFYDGKNIPFKNNYFDSVLSTEVFEHVFNLDEVLAELYRVLKPGGYLVATMPFVWPEHEIPYDNSRYSTYGLKHLIKTKTKFGIIKIERSGNYVEACFQIWINYIYQSILPENRYLKRILYAIFFSHLTALAFLFSSILPEDDSLYLNNIIVLKK
jgi:ubiquinone/menaquinone biosynthesis C-methylase UbiE